ncbi:MAG: transglutaminase protein [Phycisphaerales bacterium]|nr:transglutaminase protein [Phycisphaerales bacterium]
MTKYLQIHTSVALRLSAMLMLLVAAGCGGGDASVPKPLVPLAAPASQPAALLPATQPAPQARTFVLRYVATIKDLPASAERLDLWLPIPPSNGSQIVTDISIDAPFPHEIVTESVYGGQVAHLWSKKPIPTTITLTFRATRRPGRALPDPEEISTPRTGLESPADRYLQPDRLGIIDDRIKALADQITAGRTDAVSKSRAIYDYVIAHMAYDKTTPGWGRGDTARACEVGKGNCTDFHALFISLARAQHIPARFEIGFQLPTDKRSGKIEGYHCWSEFWSPDLGWIPVDCSEAWKHSAMKEFYFGGLDPDRIAISLGRDLTLPGMHGEPVNYLLNPYAEVDGKIFSGVEKTVTFEEK